VRVPGNDKIGEATGVRRAEEGLEGPEVRAGGFAVTEPSNELRQAQSAEQADRDLLSVLKAAQADPSRLLATPGRLLESQPALRRLKEGLVDAQLRSAQCQGRMSDAHPLVLAAKEAEQEVARQLHNELGMAIRGVEVELKVNADRLTMLEGQQAKVNGQLVQLAEVRANYANLVGEVKNRETLRQRAEQNLAEARACQASAKASSLIGLVDTPDTGVNPIGAGRQMIALSGLLGGLLFGMGLVVLTTTAASAPVPPPTVLRPTFNTELSLREMFQKSGYRVR
jgi:uncharacterized protein involved in exopolysaccharide biosynthesis